MRRSAAVLIAAMALARFATAGSAPDILKDAGVTGGLVVQIGCPDPAALTALRTSDGIIVQGLDTSAGNVADVREAVAAKKLRGAVSARTFDGKTLPYRDNLVNLVVVADPKSTVPQAELLRILAPNGKAWIGGKVTTKPRPAGLDEWTHYHHDPEGTMVGEDKVTGPPRGIQWMAGPKWLRNHDFMSSMHAMVSAGGRVFYVIDEGLRNHIFLPSRWVLIAREAFNGTVLWKRAIKDWHPNNYPLKSGPGQFPRRLVAAGNRVYVTFGQTDPLTVLDAATGETVRTLGSTKGAEEIVCDKGVLYLVVVPGRKKVNYKASSTSYKEIGLASSRFGWTPASPVGRVMAIDAESGKTLWAHGSKVAPLTLTLSDDKVFFANGTGMVALNRKDGKPLWTSGGPAIKKVGTGGALRVVYSDGVLVTAVGTRTIAHAAKDGRELWKNSLLKSSHHCPEDIFVIDGSIWSAHTGTPQRAGTHLKVVDLKTGEVKQDFRAKNLPAFPMHPRCYPSRATTKYLILNGMGCEFYPLGSKEVEIFNYVRGSCIYGLMPANGLLYKPADSCACYYQSKLEHFCALAPVSALTAKTPESARLVKGPAYEKIPQSAFPTPQSTDWPMYRRDPARSGSNPGPIKAQLQPRWSVELGGKLTQPVIADGRVFVSSIPHCTLTALDAKTGKVVWQHLAGGKIDSPPTVHNGTVLFGCADGWVTCLRAADGALAWRYLVAPADVQIVSYQQVESVWPVHGSVLVVNDVLYAMAGRNMFFDGGMRLVRLNPKTGAMLSENMMNEKDPETGKNLQELIIAKYMPIANPDIFSSDGKRLYMQEQNFGLDGKRIGVAPTLPGKGAADAGKHLFCQTGLLDDVWFHRSYWIYGNNCGEGWGNYANTRRSAPCGRILAFDEKRVYGFRSDPLGNMLHPRTTYKLFAAAKSPELVPPPAPKQPKAKDKKGRKVRVRRPRGGGIKHIWQVETPGLLVNAMVLGRDRLFVAGPPDLADETKMLGYLPGEDDDTNKALGEQSEAWLGKRGGSLWAVSLEDGSRQAACKLDSIPVFDGMSAARGNLYLSLRSGHVACYGPK